MNRQGVHLHTAPKPVVAQPPAALSGYAMCPCVLDYGEGWEHGVFGRRSPELFQRQVTGHGSELAMFPGRKVESSVNSEMRKMS